MSDPVTNVEIEDVLSSIRRLVAEGRTSKPPAARTQTTGDGAPDRLVLTPALRVADAPEASIAEREEAETRDDAQPVAEETETPELKTPDAEPAPLTLEGPVFLRSEGAKPPSRGTSLEATIAELEAAVTAQPDEWEPDGSEEEAAPAFALNGFPPLREVDDVEEEEASAPADSPAEPEVFVSSRQQTDGEVDSVADEALGFDFQPEADTAAEDAANEEAAPTPAFVHHEPAGLDVDDDDLAAYMGEDTIIDEDALRAMIAEILREELQGPLGERITRNVRKLVRQEIQRALSARDIS